MKASEFNHLLNEVTKRMKKTLSVKAGEYASDRDRLHNFKRAAAFESSTPEQALRGMLTKHLVSIYDLIDATENDEEILLSVWKEKITDSINYFVLLEALIMERYFAQTEYK